MASADEDTLRRSPPHNHQPFNRPYHIRQAKSRAYERAKDILVNSSFDFQGNSNSHYKTRNTTAVLPSLPNQTHDAITNKLRNKTPK